MLCLSMSYDREGETVRWRTDDKLYCDVCGRLKELHRFPCNRRKKLMIVYGKEFVEKFARPKSNEVKR
jgi:hypothetical protein